MSRETIERGIYFTTMGALGWIINLIHPFDWSNEGMILGGASLVVLTIIWDAIT